MLGRLSNRMFLKAIRILTCKELWQCEKLTFQRKEKEKSSLILALKPRVRSENNLWLPQGESLTLRVLEFCVSGSPARVQGLCVQVLQPGRKPLAKPSLSPYQGMVLRIAKAGGAIRIITRLYSLAETPTSTSCKWCKSLEVHIRPRGSDPSG